MALKYDAAADQIHIGVVYRLEAEDTAPHLSHFAWDKRLLLWRLPDEYSWGISGLDSISKRVVAAWVDVLSGKNARTIGYGFRTNGPTFSPDGSYVPQPAGKGLTCATYVMRVFSERGYQLLNEPSWPPRADDAVWQEKILRRLEEDDSVSRIHIAALRADQGVARFRPEEVAAGVLATDIPITFEQAVAVGNQVLIDLGAKQA